MQLYGYDRHALLPIFIHFLTKAWLNDPVSPPSYIVSLALH